MGSALDERLYLIRHGRPLAGWGGADPDPGLDGVGREQAMAAAQALLSLPASEQPRHVVSSPLRRCRETAAPLADLLGTKLEIDPAIGEIPTPLALSIEERPAWLRSAMAGRWREIVGDLDYDGWRREVTTAVSRYPGYAVFSHFVAINAVLSTIAGDERVVSFRPDHASITTFRLVDGGLSLSRLGAEALTGVA